MTATVIPFDSFKFVKTLTDSGVSPEQAEAHVSAFRNAHEENMDVLATKEDIRGTKEDIRALREEIKEEIGGLNLKISNLESKMSEKMSDMKIGLIKFILGTVFSLMTVQTATIVSFMKFFH